MANTSKSENKKYIVLRNGLRVSELIHESTEQAQSERDHWQRIVERWPDGSKIEIKEYTGR